MSSSPHRRMRRVAEKRAVRELRATERREIVDRQAPIESVGHVQDMIGVAVTQAMAYHLEHHHRPWWKQVIRYIRRRVQARRLARLREENAEAYRG